MAGRCPDSGGAAVRSRGAVGASRPQAERPGADTYGGSDMRRRTLLTRVLVANLLLVSVAVLAAGLLANPGELRNEPTVGVVLAFAIALTILVNLFMIQRRFEPLERVIE